MYKAIVFLLISVTSYAQLISGRVVDENNIPIEGVQVFLDNTSIAVNTNQYGNFQLNNKDYLNTNIVFRLLGYQTQILSIQNTLYVKLSANNTELKELVIQKSKFTRAQLLRAFKKNFLGTTRAGRSCKILNEDAIDLSYNPKTYTLEAFCNDPIQVTNNYTQYLIYFDLNEFVTQYSNYSIDPKNVISNTFIGTSVFKDLSPDNKSAQNNRKKVYAGSINHFLHNVLHRVEENKQFVLYDGSLPTAFATHFEILPQQNKFMLKIISPDKFKTEGIAIKNFSKKFNLLYNNSQQSILVFKEKEILIDKFGNYNPIQAIQLGGELAKNRLGNMLPLDFNEYDNK